MQFVRSFFKRITDDLKQKKLIPLKILFFVHASTLFVLYPYLTIHMRELGINVEETAIMSAVTPVVSIVMPPLAGMLADKIGNFRLLLALSSVLGGASALLLLAVPVGRITVTFPPAVELLASCDSAALRLRNVQDYPCTPLHPYAYDINLTVLSCGFACDLQEEATSDEMYSILRTQSYDVHLQSQLDSRRLLYRHTVTSHLAPAPPMRDQSTSRILTNDPYFNTSVSKVSDSEIFFPTPRLFDVECSHDSTNATCRFGKADLFAETDADVRMYRARISHDAQKPPADVRNYWVAALAIGNVTKFDDDYDGVESITCQDNFDAGGGEGVRVEAGSLRLSGCSAACTIAVPRKLLCDNKQQQIELDPAFTFWTYLAIVQLGESNLGKEVARRIQLGWAAFRKLRDIFSSKIPQCLKTKVFDQCVERGTPMFSSGRLLADDDDDILVRVFIGIIGGTAFAMFEGAVIAIVREQKADYGLQRVYGSLGGMISSPLSGLLIDYASKGKGYTDFRPAFYLYAVLKVASGALMLSIDLEFKQPAQNLLEDVISVFKRVEIVALFIACFIMGTAWGYIESFLFWLLQDLGASRSLMGITITVGGVAGLPLLVLSGPIIRRLGHANVLFIGFVFYAIRLLGYSLIYNPWLCLIFEALESVTSSLSFTAAVTYAARLSSTTTDTSVQGLLGGLYYGVGKGAGSLIGGYLMKFFGTRPTYQIFSCATFITGCIYYLFNKFYLRKRAANDDNDLCKKKPRDVENREPIEEKVPVEGATKIETPDVVLSETRTKLVADSTDGGSDSGVENPAYNDSETASKRDEPKVVG